MKKLLLTAALAVSSFSLAFSQTFVSTLPSNKNVVLEEYTGIYCQYCPDGHRIAHEIDSLNPGRVCLINIHSTSTYSTPVYSTDLDFRTASGDSIAKSAGITGFPTGSVNRRTSPWTKGRDTWAASAATVMGQSSPVNVAVKSHVDLNTRELITEVEYYYTAASAKSTNYLTVVLTQNNIVGTQTGGSTWNPNQVTADGHYIHNHAFRMILNTKGAWGDVIDTTTATAFGYRKFVTTLPDTIGNIPLKLYDLEVNAFISEAKNNILSGANAAVDYDKSNFVDMSITDITVVPSSNCFTSINPQVEVTNLSDSTVKSFDIYAQVNNDIYKYSYTGSLAKNQKTIIDWGSKSVVGQGVFKLNFSGFENINGGVKKDIYETNNSINYTGTCFSQNAETIFTAGFDDTELPINTVLDQSQNAGFTSVLSTSEIGANSTKGAVRYYLHSSWGLEGLPGGIILGGIDLSKISVPVLTYYYAYSDGELGGSAPSISVEASEDCGGTWVNVTDPIELTETGQPSDPSYLYVPATEDYTKVTVSLDAFKNKSILLKISGIPGTSGNAMYIDEISVSYPTSVTEEVKSNLSLYPNPADLEIKLSDKNNIGLEYSIFNLLGEVVAKGVNTENRIDINSLNSGCYYIQINNTTQKFVKK